MADEKYIVFKRWEFDSWFDNLEAEFPILPANLADAVVIRMQDLFAAPALWTYANSIALAASLLRNGDAMAKSHAKQLQDIADYFSDRATESQEYAKKLPD